MPANLAYDANGNAMFVSLRESPWHREGVVVQEELPGREFLTVAGLDYQVDKCPLFGDVRVGGKITPVGWDTAADRPIMKVAGGELTRLEHPTQRGVYRTDTGALLPSTVTEGFEVFQNTEIIDFFEGLVKDKKIIYECAGALGAGEEVWVLARIPDLSMAIKGDESTSYMLIRNGHCGNVTLQCFPTTVRVVCQNTMAAAQFERSKERWGTSTGGYAIRHTRNMRTVVDEVQTAYRRVLDNFQAQKELYELLAGTPITEESKRKFFTWFALQGRDESKILKLYGQNPDGLSRGDKTALTRFSGVIDTLEELFESPTNQVHGTRNTLYSLLGSAVEYIDHVRTTRCAEGENDGRKRFESAMFGSGAKLKLEATTKALELVTAA